MCSGGGAAPTPVPGRVASARWTGRSPRLLFPSDDAGVGVPLSDGFGGKVPIWLDAGWRFNPSVCLGAYLEYGPTFVKDCPAGSSCSASDVRLGVNFLYHFIPGAPFDPWAGIGVGYEWLNASQDGVDAGLHGWEFVNVQLGGDFAVGSGFAIGPCVVFGLGQYGTLSASAGGQSGSLDIPSGNQALHGVAAVRPQGHLRPVRR